VGSHGLGARHHAHDRASTHTQRSKTVNSNSHLALTQNVAVMSKQRVAQHAHSDPKADYPMDLAPSRDSRRMSA
jgi:hypothetical protein